MLQGGKEGKPLIVRLNTGVQSIIGNKLYPFRIGIAIPLTKPQENGLPIGEENLFFNQIEDEIVAYFGKEQRGFVCAIVTTSGMKEYMTYSKTDDIKNLIETLKLKFPGYDFQNYVEKDEHWDGYKEFNKQG